LMRAMKPSPAKKVVPEALEAGPPWNPWNAVESTAIRRNARRKTLPGRSHQKDMVDYGNRLGYRKCRISQASLSRLGHVDSGHVAT